MSTWEYQPLPSLPYEKEQCDAVYETSTYTGEQAMSYVNLQWQPGISPSMLGRVC